MKLREAVHALLAAGLLLAFSAGVQASITAPTDISGTVLWLDATDPAAVIHTTNPGFVEQWSDKSAVGTDHFTPAMASATVSDTLIQNWGIGAVDLDGDYHLTVSSTCRGAGTSTANTPSVDYDQQPRGGSIDIGADQYQ